MTIDSDTKHNRDTIDPMIIIYTGADEEVDDCAMSTSTTLSVSVVASPTPHCGIGIPTTAVLPL